MTTEILINVAPRENRAALIENGVLTELFVERQSRRGMRSVRSVTHRVRDRSCSRRVAYRLIQTRVRSCQAERMSKLDFRRWRTVNASFLAHYSPSCR